MNDQVLGYKKLLTVRDGKPLYKKALDLLQQARPSSTRGSISRARQPSGRADIEDAVLMLAVEDLDTAMRVRSELRRPYGGRRADPGPVRGRTPAS